MEEGTAAKKGVGRPQKSVDEIVSDGKDEEANEEIVEDGFEDHGVNAMVMEPGNQENIDIHYDDTLRKTAEPRNKDIIKWDDQER
jgi:hypothetical protein